MASRRLNITIREGVSDFDALAAIGRVVKMGRVSGMDDDTYCYHTTFTNPRDGAELHVSVRIVRAALDAEATS